MRDIHCHILPGVDDGARDLDESLAMLAAARAVGVTSIVCTPHVRDPYFDYERMWAAYDLLVAHAGGFPIRLPRARRRLPRMAGLTGS
jgi:protein-tyrosine phosphatase